MKYVVSEHLELEDFSPVYGRPEIPDWQMRWALHECMSCTVWSCFATLKMQACSAETSASRKNRINKALNQYDEVPVQLLKESYSYTVASTVRVTACRNQSLNTPICKWWGNGRGLSSICYIYGIAIQLLSRPHAVESNPQGVGRSPCRTEECLSLRCIYLKRLPPSSG